MSDDQVNDAKDQAHGLCSDAADRLKEMIETMAAVADEAALRSLRRALAAAQESLELVHAEIDGVDVE